MKTVFSVEELVAARCLLLDQDGKPHFIPPYDSKEKPLSPNDVLKVYGHTVRRELAAVVAMADRANEDERKYIPKLLCQQIVAAMETHDEVHGYFPYDTASVPGPTCSSELPSVVQRVMTRTHIPYQGRDDLRNILATARGDGLRAEMGDDAFNALPKHKRDRLLRQIGDRPVAVSLCAHCKEEEVVTTVNQVVRAVKRHRMLPELLKPNERSAFSGEHFQPHRLCLSCIGQADGFSGRKGDKPTAKASANSKGSAHPPQKKPVANVGEAAMYAHAEGLKKAKAAVKDSVDASSGACLSATSTEDGIEVSSQGKEVN